MVPRRDLRVRRRLRGRRDGPLQSPRRCQARVGQQSDRGVHVWVSTALATASDSRDGVVASTSPRVQVKYRLGGYARGGSGVESVDHHSVQLCSMRRPRPAALIELSTVSIGSRRAASQPLLRPAHVAGDAESEGQPQAAVLGHDGASPA